MAKSRREVESAIDEAPALDEGMLPDFITGKPVKETRGPDHPRLVDWQGTPSLATLFSAGVL